MDGIFKSKEATLTCFKTTPSVCNLIGIILNSISLSLSLQRKQKHTHTNPSPQGSNAFRFSFNYMFHRDFSIISQNKPNQRQSRAVSVEPGIFNNRYVQKNRVSATDKFFFFLCTCGVIVCLASLSSNLPKKLPRRYCLRAWL